MGHGSIDVQVNQGRELEFQPTVEFPLPEVKSGACRQSIQSASNASFLGNPRLTSGKGGLQHDGKIRYLHLEGNRTQHAQDSFEPPSALRRMHGQSRPERTVHDH